MEKKDLALNKKILEYLVTIGIQPKLSGFEYLRLAIKLVMQNKNYLANITKMLYPVCQKVRQSQGKASWLYWQSQGKLSCQYNQDALP